MSHGSIIERLRQPERQVSIRELAGFWFHQSIEVRLSNIGFLAPDWSILAAIRGAWGQRLMRAASQESLDGKPCPWSPPCAFDIFFREQGRQGRQAIAKPYAVQLDRDGADLIVRLLVFGLACEWVHVAAHALVEALSDHIDWTRGHRVPPNLAVKPLHVEILTTDGLSVAEGAGRAAITFLTPFDDETGGFRDDPSALLSRLARRVSALAPWQDAEVIENWPDRSEEWRAVEYEQAEIETIRVKRNSRQAGRFDRDAISGALGLSFSEGSDIPALLAFAQVTGAGRGVTAGQGRLSVSY